MKPIILLFILSLCAANTRAQRYDYFPVDSTGHVVYEGTWKMKKGMEADVIYSMVHHYIVHRFFMGWEDNVALDQKSTHRLNEDPVNKSITIWEACGADKTYKGKGGIVQGDSILGMGTDDTIMFVQYLFSCYDNMLTYNIRDLKYYIEPKNWGKDDQNSIQKFPFESIMYDPFVQLHFCWVNMYVLEILAGLKYYLDKLKLQKESEVDIGYLNQN